MVTYYCPSCWAEFHEDVRVCPHCGFEMGSFDSLEYQQKLLMAAFHPVSENRYMAVEALGMLQMREALPVLEKILDEELEDVYLIHEVLKALAKIPDPRSRELLRRATGHRYRLVREKAKELLEKSEK